VREISLPGAVAFFQAQRFQGIHAEVGDAEVGPGGEHGVVKRRQLGR
jgi:hypothetical protein